jgi:hypothetical protein
MKRSNNMSATTEAIQIATSMTASKYPVAMNEAHTIAMTNMAAANFAIRLSSGPRNEQPSHLLPPNLSGLFIDNHSHPSTIACGLNVNASATLVRNRPRTNRPSDWQAKFYEEDFSLTRIGGYLDAAE